MRFTTTGDIVPNPALAGQYRVQHVGGEIRIDPKRAQISGTQFQFISDYGVLRDVELRIARNEFVSLRGTARNITQPRAHNAWAVHAHVLNKRSVWYDFATVLDLQDVKI